MACERLGGQLAALRSPWCLGRGGQEEFQLCTLVSHRPGFRAPTRQQGVGDPLWMSSLPKGCPERCPQETPALPWKTEGPSGQAGQEAGNKALCGPGVGVCELLDTHIHVCMCRRGSWAL